MDCIYTMCDYLDINCLTVKRRRLWIVQCRMGKISRDRFATGV